MPRKPSIRPIRWTLPMSAAMSLTLVSLALPVSQAHGATPPAPAASAGYRTRTFWVSHFDETVVDTKGSYRPGYGFYHYNYWYRVNARHRLNVSNGILTASGGARGDNGSATTLGCLDAACGKFVGTAFGGGAYVEAVIAYDADKVDTNQGWPSVWMLGAESITHMPQMQWAGQPTGYMRNVEVDLLEQQYADKSKFSTAVHDWWGVYKKTCPQMAFCRTTASRSWKAPPGHDFSQFHKIALLWVPATTSRPGRAVFYYDGVQLGAPVTWRKHDPAKIRPPIATSSPFAWDVLDRQHMVLILGAGHSAPIRVRSVAVWQRDSSRNIKR